MFSGNIIVAQVVYSFLVLLVNLNSIKQNNIVFNNSQVGVQAFFVSPRTKIESRNDHCKIHYNSYLLKRHDIPIAANSDVITTHDPSIIEEEQNDDDDKNEDSPSTSCIVTVNTRPTSTRKKLLTKSKVVAIIDSLIQSNNTVQSHLNRSSAPTAHKNNGESDKCAPDSATQYTMGVLGEPMPTTRSTEYGHDCNKHLCNQQIKSKGHVNSTNHDVCASYNKSSNKPGTILIPQQVPITTKSSLLLSQSSQPLQNHISVSIASEGNDAEIANLRLSVFSNYSIAVDKKQFVDMSCDVIQRRRNKGAINICATVNYYDDITDSGDDIHGYGYDQKIVNSVILGGLECSTHEFIGTELGMRRPIGSILYITEVAVSPKTRRCGAGKLLMKGVDELAKRNNIETVYLHVDVTNIAAFSLYRQAGYDILDPNDSMYAQFTYKLNLHDGATRGRIHHLMHKKIKSEQTWYESSLSSNFGLSHSGTGTLGFEMVES